MQNNIFKDTALTGFLRLPEVLKLIPVSKSTWWLGVKDGIYPKPVKLGKKIVAWKREDINKLIQEISANK